MFDNIAEMKHIVVINEDNVIVNVFDGVSPVMTTVDKKGNPLTFTLTPITSIEQLRFSLPLDIVYVRIDENAEQISEGIFNLTHDNYNDFISNTQAINLR